MDYFIERNAEGAIEALYAKSQVDGMESLPEDNAEVRTFLHPFISPFKPIEPVPFWIAAWDLLQLKKSDVYGAISHPDELYLAELDIEGRKTYRRDDPMVDYLATLLGYPPEQMDSLWLYVQENYE